MKKFLDWWNFQGEIKDMKSANHSHRNKKFRGQLIKKQLRRYFKNVDKE